MTAKTRTRLFLLWVFVAGVVVSFFFTSIKYAALGFNTRDYDYYAQFVTKILDNCDETLEYSINPVGHNFLLFHGVEGAKNFHQSIHFEPIKYLYALIYFLTGELRPVFLFLSVVFFLPVAYLAIVHPLDSAADRRFLILFAALYLAFPSSLKAPSYDLRPYVVLAPVFALAMTGLILARPFAEVFVLFNCMFLAREEALVFGIILVGYASVTWYGSSSFKKKILALFLAWLSWLLGILLFFHWTGFENNYLQRTVSYVSAHFITVLLVFALACVAVFLVFAFGVRCIQRRWISLGVMQLAAYGAVLPPLVFQYLTTYASLDVDLYARTETLFSLRFSLHFIVMCVLILITWHVATKDAFRNGILVLLALGVAASLAVALLPSYGITWQYRVWENNADYAKPVRELRRFTDKCNTGILSDLATHQAFYDYRHAYAYDRLPWRLVPEGSSSFQDGRVVRRLLNDDIEYIVITRAKYFMVRQFLLESRLAAKTIFENAGFVGLEITR